MNLNFSKYHGCGNDFICVDARKIDLDVSLVAKDVCRRHFSVGADGFICLLPSDSADYKMLISNSDGSIPEMCGNGLRCFVHFLHDLGLIKDRFVSIETGAGVLKAKIVEKNGCNANVFVEMGQAYFLDQLPRNDFIFDNYSEVQIPITIGSHSLIFTPVSMGNPHAVIIVDDLDAINVMDIGSQIELHSFFPNGVNVEFIQVLNNQTVKMRVWERGVGETAACGTGACASVVAGHLLNLLDSKEIDVQLLGGQLKVTVDMSTSFVTVNGPSEFVFSSEITLP